jgi:hypothetical protein
LQHGQRDAVLDAAAGVEEFGLGEDPFASQLNQRRIANQIENVVRQHGPPEDVIWPVSSVSPRPLCFCRRSHIVATGLRGGEASDYPTQPAAEGRNPQAVGGFGRIDHQAVVDNATVHRSEKCHKHDFLQGIADFFADFPLRGVNRLEYSLVSL